MKKETIKKKVAENFTSAEFYREDDDSVWYIVPIVSSKELARARLPYVQLLPCDVAQIYLIVFTKF